MRSGADVVLRAAGRFYAPFMLLAAFALLATRAPGAGVGLIAGLAFAMALVLQLVVMGAEAARAAAPAPVMRLFMGAGLALALTGAAAPRLAYAPQLAEAGLFLIVVGALAQFVVALAGRAPTLRDEGL